MRTLAFVLLATLVSGCSSQATLAVYTQPAGAYLTAVGSGTAFGIAPRLVVYPKYGLKSAPDGTGCYLAGGIEARWVSGARTVLDPIRICGSPAGNYNITLTRDPAWPDMEKDLQFALQAESAQAQQRQAQAASDAALISAYSVLQQAAPVRCTARQVGETVQTVCQ